MAQVLPLCNKIVTHAANISLQIFNSFKNGKKNITHKLRVTCMLYVLIT